MERLGFPYQGIIAWAILEELEALGGEAKTEDIFPRVTQRLKQLGRLTDESLRIAETSGANAWQHRLHTVRAGVLVPRGWLDPNAPRGTWRLTPAAWAGLFTVRAIDLSDELGSWAERLNQMVGKSAEWQKVNRTEMVQKIKELVEMLTSSDKVGDIPKDFVMFSLSYKAGVRVTS